MNEALRHRLYPLLRVLTNLDVHIDVLRSVKASVPLAQMVVAHLSVLLRLILGLELLLAILLPGAIFSGSVSGTTSVCNLEIHELLVVFVVFVVFVVWKSY